MNRKDFEYEVKEIKETIGYFGVLVGDDELVIATDYKIVNKFSYEELYLYVNGKLIAKAKLGDVIGVDYV
jgi:hypothetical protein